MSEQQRLSSAVNSIAWGYILIHVNFNLGTMDILPGWVGYLLICSSFSALAVRERSVSLLRPLGIILIIWNLIDWIVTTMNGRLNLYGLEILVVVLGLYFHFQLLTNLARIAEQFECPESGRLLKLRTAITVLNAVMQVCLYWLTQNAAVVWLVIIVQLILTWWLCSTLFRFKRSLLEAEGEDTER